MKNKLLLSRIYSMSMDSADELSYFPGMSVFRKYTNEIVSHCIKGKDRFFTLSNLSVE